MTDHEGREKELEWSFDVKQTEYNCDFGHRMLWLRCKGGVERISQRLQLLQTRRIAVEVTEMHFLIVDTMGEVRRCEDGLKGIEERLQMSRIG